MPTSPLSHSWNVTPREAIQIQQRLAGRVIHQSIDRSVHRVAGGDIAFSSDGSRLVAAWVVWDLKLKAEIERTHVVQPVRFPYVPGLLSFREAPALIEAVTQLSSRPEVLMFDGQGIAHPRRVGLASHVGLLVNRPSIGCAKSRLCGEHREPGAKRGASVRLMDRGELIGRVVRTRDNTSPLYVSTGHLATLEDAVRLTLACAVRFRMPEPTRLAHQYVTSLRNSL